MPLMWRAAPVQSTLGIAESVIERFVGCESIVRYPPSGASRFGVRPIMTRPPSTKSWLMPFGNFPAFAPVPRSATQMFAWYPVHPEIGCEPQSRGRLAQPDGYEPIWM